MVSDPARLTNRNLGYIFCPPDKAPTPGVARLEVVLRDEPTELHFDPEAIMLTTRIGEGQVDEQTFYHPWPWEKKHWVCPGWIRLYDRKGERVQAYTFGGDFEVCSQDQETTCILESTAPLLDLHAGDDVARLLAAEVEILLAEQRAELLADLSAYGVWLANLTPLDFYATCLAEFQQRFKNFPDQDLRRVQEFLNFLEIEISDLKRKNLWPTKLTDMPTLK